MAENQNQEQEPQLSDAQMKQMRENMQNFYKQQIPLLKQQCQYEQLLADIEEARAKRLTMSIRIAQMMAGPAQGPEGPKEGEEKETMHRNPDGSPAHVQEQETPVTEKKERKLKTE